LFELTPKQISSLNGSAVFGQRSLSRSLRILQNTKACHTTILNEESRKVAQQNVPSLTIYAPKSKHSQTPTKEKHNDSLIGSSKTCHLIVRWQAHNHKIYGVLFLISDPHPTSDLEKKSTFLNALASDPPHTAPRPKYPLLYTGSPYPFGPW